MAKNKKWSEKKMAQEKEINQQIEAIRELIILYRNKRVITYEQYIEATDVLNTIEHYENHSKQED
jgi:hypothetical protein